MKAARPRTRHGLSAAKARVKLRGLAAIDMRTVAARQMVAFRDDLVSALGGEDGLSPSLGKPGRSLGEVRLGSTAEKGRYVKRGPIGRPRRVVDAEGIRRRRDSGQSWRTIARALHCPTTTLRRSSQACQNPADELRHTAPRLARSSETPEGPTTT